MLIVFFKLSKDIEISPCAPTSSTFLKLARQDLSLRRRLLPVAIFFKATLDVPQPPSQLPHKLDCWYIFRIGTSLDAESS